MPVPIGLPEGVLAMAARGDAWAEWVRILPRRSDELLEEWQLTRDGAAMHGYCALVLPVRTAGGAPAVLKLTFTGDLESVHEHLALQRWAGRGAVRLLRADPRRRALLLERLGSQSLRELPIDEACDVVAGLYAEIHVAAIPQLVPLTDHLARSTEALASLPRSAPVPHRLVEQAVSLSRDLLTEEATGTLVHGDLHYDNVLAADREPWLVIDPKPMSGDPHYEPAPMLWNRWEEIVDDVRSGVRRRFHALVDGAMLDEDRARDWVVVRMMHNALWLLEDEPDVARGSSSADHLTLCVAIAKAVQD